MFGLENLDALFVVWAFLFQIVLIAHFALRKWHFDIAIRYGPIVYAVLFVISTILNVTSHISPIVERNDMKTRKQ